RDIDVFFATRAELVSATAGFRGNDGYVSDFEIELQPQGAQISGVSHFPVCPAGDAGAAGWDPGPPTAPRKAWVSCVCWALETIAEMKRTERRTGAQRITFFIETNWPRPCNWRVFSRGLARCNSRISHRCLAIRLSISSRLCAISMSRRRFSASASASLP